MAACQWSQRFADLGNGRCWPIVGLIIHWASLESELCERRRVFSAGKLSSILNDVRWFKGRGAAFQVLITEGSIH